MRHAKAEQSAATDHERELAERGHADAAAAGRWLAARGVEPDYALVSAAVRTRGTWDALAEGAGWDLDPEFDGRCTPPARRPRSTCCARSTRRHDVIVVGHNPTMASLAQILDDGDGDAEAGNEMARASRPRRSRCSSTTAGGPSWTRRVPASSRSTWGG